MSRFQSKVIKQFEKKGYYVVNLIKTNKNGMPDLMMIKDGKVSFCECKEANDTLKELQKFRIDELKKVSEDAFCLQDGKGKIY